MRYRDMRIPCDTEVTALLGEEGRRVRFVNISGTGARIEGLGRAPRDALVTLVHLNNRISARVAWSNENQTGLRFLVPLSPANINMLRGTGGPKPGTRAPGLPTQFRELS